MVSPVGFAPTILASILAMGTPELQRRINIREEYIEALSSCVFPTVYLLVEFEPLTTQNKLGAAGIEPAQGVALVGK